MKVVPTHKCQVCNALWRINLKRDSLFENDTWQLVSKECGKCCDNSFMGEQIVPVEMDDIKNLIKEGGCE